MNQKYTEKIRNSKISAIAKGLCIIEFISNERDVSLADIAEEFGIAKSTVSSILSTLKDFGYVEQTNNKNYKLGTHLFELGNRVRENWNIHVVSKSYIDEMYKELKTTIHLAILSEEEVLYIDKREAQNEFKIVSKIGSRLPLYCTAVGKVLLAYKPDEQINKILSRIVFKKYTENTITDSVQLKQELNDIRLKGFAFDNEEIMNNLCCIAAPIRDNSNEVIASISISDFSNRLCGEELEKAKRIVIETANKISNELGWQKTRF